MPRFEGQYEETFTVDAPLKVVADHFGDLDTIAANYGPLLRFERIGDDTLHLILEPKSEKGVTFNGEQKCRWQRPSDDVLTWDTAETRNMWSKGRATFTAVGENRTRVHFSQNITTEMQVNRLLAKVIQPIVKREIAKGVQQYLERMRKSLRAK